MSQPKEDGHLADVTREEYLAAQEEFPGFVDDEGAPLDDDVAEDDEYAHGG